MKKAFTLIELLVVIAIIAILAAILFPVFAQAKEAAKKTGTVSNAKQIGTAIIMYTTDYDDTFPMVAYFRSNGAVLNGLTGGLQIPYPAGWNPSFGTSALAMDVQACLWANATLPYTKSTDLAQVTGAPIVTISADVNPAGATKAPGTIGFQYNGLLSTYSATAMDNPSLVPLATTSHGRMNNRGRAYAVPALACGNANPGETQCQFNPSGAPNRTGSYTRGAIWDANTNAEVHTKSFIAVRTDSSARSYRLSSSSRTPNKNILEPFSGYNEKGAGVSGRLCSLDANTIGAYYPCFYRPDQDGTRTKWADIVEAE